MSLKTGGKDSKICCYVFYLFKKTILPCFKAHGWLNFKGFILLLRNRKLHS